MRDAIGEVDDEEEPIICAVEDTCAGVKVPRGDMVGLRIEVGVKEKIAV